MNPSSAFMSRRGFVRGGLAFGAALFTTPGLFAEQLLGTPRLTEGPFYPDRLPLDTDNDLLIVNDKITPAVGDITHLTGKVVDTAGNPIKNAVVEIWQCDANAVYLHTSDSGPKAKQRDGNFQGFGRCATGAKGEYYFRTIKPVPYPGRPAPHIHVKVKRGGRDLLTTQLLIRGHAGNARDGVYAGLTDTIDRELVLVDFKPIKESKIGEWGANFVVVVGKTPDEATLESPRPRGR